MLHLHHPHYHITMSITLITTIYAFLHYALGIKWHCIHFLLWLSLNLGDSNQCLPFVALTLGYVCSLNVFAFSWKNTISLCTFVVNMHHNKCQSFSQVSSLQKEEQNLLYFIMKNFCKWGNKYSYWIRMKIWRTNWWIQSWTFCLVTTLYKFLSYLCRWSLVVSRSWQ